DYVARASMGSSLSFFVVMRRSFRSLFSKLIIKNE
ncbi:DUF956 domain-containing protein, partial [Salmonella enterica subsp. enterica serovar Newport]